MPTRLRRAKTPAQLRRGYLSHRRRYERSMKRTTSVPFREWPWRARVIERLYRLTHGGQIRTLVVSRRP